MKVKKILAVLLAAMLLFAAVPASFAGTAMFSGTCKNYFQTHTLYLTNTSWTAFYAKGTTVSFANPLPSLSDTFLATATEHSSTDGPVTRLISQAKSVNVPTSGTNGTSLTPYLIVTISSIGKHTGLRVQNPHGSSHAMTITGSFIAN